MGDRHPNVRTVKSLSLSYTHIHTVWAAHCFVVHKKGTNFSPAQHRNPWVSRQRLSGLLYTWYYMHLASILCVTGLHSQAGNIPCIHTEIWFQCVYAGKYPSSFVPRPCRQSPPHSVCFAFASWRVSTQRFISVYMETSSIYTSLLLQWKGTCGGYFHGISLISIPSTSSTLSNEKFLCTWSFLKTNFRLVKFWTFLCRKMRWHPR